MIAGRILLLTLVTLPACRSRPPEVAAEAGLCTYEVDWHYRIVDTDLPSQVQRRVDLRLHGRVIERRTPDALVLDVTFDDARWTFESDGEVRATFESDGEVRAKPDFDEGTRGTHLTLAFTSDFERVGPWPPIGESGGTFIPARIVDFSLIATPRHGSARSSPWTQERTLEPHFILDQVTVTPTGGRRVALAQYARPRAVEAPFLDGTERDRWYDQTLNGTARLSRQHSIPSRLQLTAKAKHSWEYLRGGEVVDSSDGERTLGLTVEAGGCGGG